MAPQRSDVGFEVLWLGQAAKQIICTADTTSAGGKNGNDVDISLLLTNLPKCVDKPAHMREKGGGGLGEGGGERIYNVTWAYINFHKTLPGVPLAAAGLASDCAACTGIQPDFN